MPSGTYTLVVELGTASTVTVGALGTRDLPAGWYAYTGSAFGPGGFARIDRHHRVATGENDTRHWHVDSLLGHPEAAVRMVGRTPDEDIECAVAGSLAGTPVEGFGATDCDCGAHLVHSSTREPLERSVRRAHAVVEDA